jgi:thioredoxin 1
MNEDPELQAIRDRLRAEMASQRIAPAAPARPVDVDDASLAEFVRGNRVAVIDVWAPWCGPCRIVGPIVDQLAGEMAGRVAFAKLNADDNPATMHAFGIQGIPTLLVFRAGRLVDRIVGALPKPALAAAIQRHAEPAA